MLYLCGVRIVVCKYSACTARGKCKNKDYEKVSEWLNNMGRGEGTFNVLFSECLSIQICYKQNMDWFT